MKKTFFFEATRRAIDELGDIMDEFSSALVSLCLMREVVNKLVANGRTPTSIKQDDMLLTPSGVRWDNFNKNFVKQTWTCQKESFAWHLLNSVCAVFEGWVAEILRLIPKRCIIDMRKVERDLQFPAKATKILDDLAAIFPAPSFLSEYSQLYNTHVLYSKANIDSLLYCYRLFKEMRNCGVHNGRIATACCFNALQDYMRNCTKLALGEKEVPKVNVFVVDGPISLSFRGVIGLTHIIMKIIITYDAELIGTQFAAKHFLERFRLVSKRQLVLSSKPSTAGSQISKAVKSAGFLSPRSWKATKDYLKQQGACV